MLVAGSYTGRRWQLDARVQQVRREPKQMFTGGCAVLKQLDTCPAASACIGMQTSVSSHTLQPPQRSVCPRTHRMVSGSNTSLRQVALYAGSSAAFLTRAR